MSDPRAPGLAELIDQAFEYRGFVTLSRRDGSRLVGFVYDRGPAHVEMFDERAERRVRVAIDEIAGVELTGEDSAAAARRIWERRHGSLEPPQAAPGEDGEGGGAARPVLILVALPWELGGVARAVGVRTRGGVVHGRLGTGRAVARALGVGGGAARAIGEERPGLVISCGLSGALDPALATGAVVLASSVCDETGEAIAADEPLLRAARQALAADGAAVDGAAGIAEGEILCASRVAATGAEKRALARPGRLAVDLESWPAARAAARAGVPWLAIRVILDPLDVELPAFTREGEGPYLAPAVRHALRGPRAALELARLALRARTARRALAHALGRVGPALVAAGGPEMSA